MDGTLKVYQMNLEGEIDAAKIAEISRVVGQLIKGEMYGLILNFESVEHINFAVLPSLVEEKGRLQAFGGDIRLAGSFRLPQEHFQDHRRSGGLPGV